MKLILQIKLLTNKEQFNSLQNTIIKSNEVCNEISETAFEKRIFNTYKLHHEVYHPMKKSSGLTAQMMIRCISKVADAYKIDKKVKSEFKKLGAISYDWKILRYTEDGISIWTVDGRINIPLICHNKKYFSYIKGEADLVFKKGKFYLYQTIDIPEEKLAEVKEFIGVDFGQTDIAVLSDGTNYNSKQLKTVRKKYSKVRASIQSKGTKSSKRKRLSGRERRFVTISNHTISKQIVQKAKAQNKGIAIEDLTRIRKTAKPKSKAQKTELNRWSFFQLRKFMAYKSLLSGVHLIAIPPAYTSKTCNVCKWIGKRNGKHFRCKHCGNISDADKNAAKNIADFGASVNMPESSTMFCSLHS